MKDLTVTHVRLVWFFLSVTLCGVAQVSGVVTDTAGRAIPSAEVTCVAADAGVKVLTGADGSFRLEPCFVPSTLNISAKGFAPRRLFVTGTTIAIILQPQTVREVVTVTAERIATPMARTSQSALVLSSERLATFAPLALDDALRYVPGFSLFRRSGSRSANPTTQGASLRGIGGSGASRILVLRDGVPLNDPFGGWIYWSRLPSTAGDVEVVQGGASHLYGGHALGGVIQQVTASPASASWLELSSSAGNQATGHADLSAGWARGRAAINASISAFQTTGYVPTPFTERGKADAAAGSRHFQTRVQPRLKISSSADVNLSLEFFHESRTNGTQLQDNHTELWQMEGAFNQRMSKAALTARIYGSGQSYGQSFSTLSADRNIESLTRMQQVPSQQLGGALEISGTAPRQIWLLGSDLRQLRGRSDENIIASGATTSLIHNGGQQFTAGWFASDRIALGSRILLSGAVRFDLWRNFAAESRTLILASQSLTVSPLADRKNLFVSPRLALLFQATPASTFSLSGYRSFRAPSLNELYRPFRVGNVVTQPNDALREESLIGVEGAYRQESARWSASFTAFWMRVDDPITNATVSASPALIVRQRRNLGATRALGIDATATLHPGKFWDLTGGYQLSHAIVISNPANVALVGFTVPQVPRHSFTLQATLVPAPRWLFSAQARASSSQFDDDLNLFALEPFAALDVLVQRRLSRNLALFIAAENLTNARYEVARTPSRSLASPALVRIGIRLRIPPRETNPPVTP